MWGEQLASGPTSTTFFTVFDNIAYSCDLGSFCMCGHAKLFHIYANEEEILKSWSKLRDAVTFFHQSLILNTNFEKLFLKSEKAVS